MKKRREERMSGAKIALLIFVVITISYAGKISLPAEDQEPFFGANTEGGINGRVIKVTSLNDSGPGTLKEALEAEGARIVIFEVGGIIDLKGGIIIINNPYLTVAGQTAPYPGITILRGGIHINASHVVFQHIALRPGTEFNNEDDGFNIHSENCIIDHCSVTWGIDEDLSLAKNSKNVTVTNCIIAEGLSHSIHKKGEHSCGTLVMDGSKGMMIKECLYVHNFRRNPRLKPGTTVFYINNVIYNYGIYAIHIGGEQGDGYSEEPGYGYFAGNVCLKGKNGWDNYFVEGHKGDFAKDMKPGNGWAYIKDNILLDRTTGDKLIEKDENIFEKWEDGFWPVNYPIKSPREALNSVLKGVGARPSQRSDIDKRIVNDVINGTGEIINSQSQVGGYPSYRQTYRKLDIPESIADRKAWLECFADSLETGFEGPDLNVLNTFIDEHWSE
ncbi:MAG: hypothetical protein JXB49_09285 [Bacteroidales bacterium]|nr:hypothetical protein [Bacteroidales bacterium]